MIRTGPADSAHDAPVGWFIDTVRPDDGPALATLSPGCSAETVRSRFFTRVATLPTACLAAVLTAAWDPTAPHVPSTASPPSIS